jgi:hypothetical protein
MTPLSQTIKVIAGWDHRPQGESYHGCELVFILRGEKGVLTFAFVTDWAPMAVQQQYMNGVQRTNVIGVQPKPIDVVFHSPTPPALPHQAQREDCPYIEGGICYAAVSKREAEALRDVMLKEGSIGVWRCMGQLYRSDAAITQNVRK